MIDAYSSHDYDPSWDYEMDENIDEEVKESSDHALSVIRSEVLPKIGMFEDVSIHFVKLEDGLLGKFVDGTSSLPVIVVDANSIFTSCQEYNCNLDVGVQSTIMHEIGHAIQEAYDLPKDEDQAEDFAFRWFKTKEVYPFWDVRRRRNKRSRGR